MDSPSLPGDALRSWLTFVLAVGMPLTTILAFATGTSFEEATRSDVGEPLIVPAGYAFIIWALIYGGSVAYGAYQVLPSQHDHPLFRRIGWYTASTFLGTCAWLVCARFGQTWLTVVCILWMAASLAPAFASLPRGGEETPLAMRWLVIMPLSVFMGWLSVAVFANTAAALKRSGWLDAGMPEANWTALMLLAAGALAAWVTLATRGNAFYAFTIVWALVAIVVANLTRERNLLVAGVAGTIALLMLIILLVIRTSPAGHDGVAARA